MIKKMTCRQSLYGALRTWCLWGVSLFCCWSLWMPSTLAQSLSSDKSEGNLGNDVLYYIVIDRFLDADPSNNVPKFAFQSEATDTSEERRYKEMNQLLLEHIYDPKHRHMGMYWGGDLQGVIDKLDYLKDLGVTKIVLSPIQDNANGFFYHPNIDNYLRLYKEDTDPDNFYSHISTAYHGYWTKDWFEIDEHFRAASDEHQDRYRLFRKLLDEAGERGLGIILDVTMNHTSPGHISTSVPQIGAGSFLFGESWFADNGNIYRHGELVATHWDPKTGTLNPQGWFHAPMIIWDFDTASQELIENGQISGGMPDIAQEVPAVEQFFLDMARFWLTFNEGGHQIAGFRLDAVKHVNAGFWQTFEDYVLSINPNAVLLGEYFGGGYNMPGSMEFLKKTQHTTQYDFNLSEAMRRFFAGDRAWDGRTYIMREHSLGRQSRNYTEPGTHWVHYLFNPAKTLEIPKTSLDAIPDKDAKGWVTFVEVQDDPRLKTFYPNMSDRAYDSLIKFQFTARGVPLVLYGTETALAIPYHPNHSGLFGVGGDPFNRPMMIWPDSPGWKEDLHTTVKKMAHLRQQFPVLRYGNTRFLFPKSSQADKDIFMIREPESSEVSGVDNTRILYAYSTKGGEFLLSMVKEGVQVYDVVETGETIKAIDGLIPIKLQPQEAKVLVFHS